MRVAPITAERRFARVYVKDIIPRGLGDLRRMLAQVGIRPRPMELSFLGRSRTLEITVHAGAVEQLVQALTSLGFPTKTGISPEDPSLLTGKRWADSSPEERAAEARRCYTERLKRLLPKQVRPSVAGFLAKELQRMGANVTRPTPRPASSTNAGG